MRWALPRATEPTRSKPGLFSKMLRWLLVIFLALILINGLVPWLRKLGFCKLPGDFSFRLWGREWFFPLATTFLFSMVAGGLSKFF